MPHLSIIKTRTYSPGVVWDRAVALLRRARPEAPPAGRASVVDAGERHVRKLNPSEVHGNGVSPVHSAELQRELAMREWWSRD